jgi:DNA-binding Xre family transcriptional regulator
MATIGENVRRIMGDRGMTGVELAQRLGVQQPTAAKMLKATKTRPATIAKLAVILECDVNELFVGVSDDYDHWRSTRLELSTGQLVGPQDKILAGEKIVTEATPPVRVPVLNRNIARGQFNDSRAASVASHRPLESDAELVGIVLAAVPHLDKLSDVFKRITAEHFANRLGSDRTSRSRRAPKHHERSSARPRADRRKRGA